MLSVSPSILEVPNLQANDSHAHQSLQAATSDFFPHSTRVALERLTRCFPSKLAAPHATKCFNDDPALAHNGLALQLEATPNLAIPETQSTLDASATCRACLPINVGSRTRLTSSSTRVVDLSFVGRRGSQRWRELAGCSRESET